jgi:hypothetical protein
MKTNEPDNDFATSCIVNYLTANLTWLQAWHAEATRTAASGLPEALEQRCQDNPPMPPIELLESITR